MKKVFGVYDDEQDLISALAKLENNGCSLDRLSILGQSITEVANRNGIVEESDQHSDSAFIDNVATSLEASENPGEHSYFDRLVGAGIHKEAAQEFVYAIEKGQMILLVDTN